jgi:hypothetical protein
MVARRLRTGERLKCRGFVERICDHAMTSSFRVACDHFNRDFYRSGDSEISLFSFSDIAIKEGQKYRAALDKSVEEILVSNGFTKEGMWLEGKELPPNLCSQEMEFIMIDPATIMYDAGLPAPTEISFAEGEFAQPETGLHPIKHKRRGERLLVPDEDRASYLEDYVQYVNSFPNRDAYSMIRHLCKIEKNVDSIINVFIDGVLVPEQSEHRVKEGKEEIRTDPTYIKHIDIRVETEDGGRYNISDVDIDKAYRTLLAILIKTGLITRNIHFFVDGEKKLKEMIDKYFKHWKRRIFLDYMHINEKIDVLTSLGIKNIRVPCPWEEPELYKNNTKGHKKGDIKEQPMTSLSRTYGSVIKAAIFYGNCDEAIDYINHIPTEHIDKKKALDDLVEYFINRKDMLTCYALRKHAGLKNSSNSSELCNEEVICARQKVDDRMHWRKDGSSSISALTLMFLNHEEKEWFLHSQIRFQLYYNEPTRVRNITRKKKEVV